MGIILLRYITLLLFYLSLFSTESVFATTAASKYVQQGLSYRQQLRYPEAIAAFKKSVELEPKNISSQVILGWTLHLAKQENAATKTLLQAASQHPFNVPTFNALGIVFLVRGDLTKAIFAHYWAAMLKRDNEIAYYNLSLAYHRLRNYEWAIATAKRAITLEPTNPHPVVALAITYWDNGDRLNAHKSYQQAVNLDSRYRDRSFLAHLQEAGFTSAQVRTTEQVLSLLN